MNEYKTKNLVISTLKDFAWAIAMVIIIFGGMYLILGPPFPPIVVVISQSMLHDDDLWSKWFIEHGINYSSFPFIDGFDKGDVIITKYSPDIKLGDVVVYERDTEHIYPNNAPIIHRVVGIVEVRNWSYYNFSGTLEYIGEEEIRRDIENIKMCNEITNNGIKDKCIYPKFPKTGNFKLYITKGDNNPISDQCGNMPYSPMHLIPEQQIITKAWILIPKIGYLKIWLNEAIDFITHPFH